MAIFQFFKGVVHSIEQFNRETVPGFDSYETPVDYGFTQNDNFRAQVIKNKFITFQIGEETVEHTVFDPDVLKVSAGDTLDVIYSGKSVVAILNKTSGYYCFYQTPLYKKFSLPKVMMGVNTAIVAIIIGYVLHLIALQLRSNLFQVISEGISLLCFVGGLIYAGYYHTSGRYRKNQIEKYIKKIEGL